MHLYIRGTAAFSLAMNDRSNNFSYSVKRTPIHFSTTDGARLNGTWFLPDHPNFPPSALIVVLCGAGIPAKFYHRMANFLAEHDAAVLTFDYRGIGESRENNIRTIQSGMESWAEFDIGAALAEAMAKFPNVSLNGIAHSVSALLVGGTPLASRLCRIVFFGPHTGYWRDYGRRWRPLLYLTWHIFMPALTRLLGYFPGHVLKLGENLPPRVALDWAGRRQAALIATPEDERRFRTLLSSFCNVRAEALALSISDDAFAPPEAAHRLLAMYSNLRVTHRVTSPAAFGRRHLGHLGFLRRPAGEFIWAQAAEFLIPTFAKTNMSHFAPCLFCEKFQRAKANTSSATAS
jgi:predicted alpha/beta hydrolase